MAQPKQKSARCNKYGPPERSPEELKELERQFVLDCVAVSTLSDDSGRANPKMATAIPPYNAQKDKHANEYFHKRVTKNLLKKTEQKPPGDSILGKQMDKLFDRGLMGTYLAYRNSAGAGHSTSQVGGHGLFMEKISPINGYNGAFGFRRNTPWLRKQPSVFVGVGFSGEVGTQKIYTIYTRRTSGHPKLYSDKVTFPHRIVLVSFYTGKIDSRSLVP